MKILTYTSLLGYHQTMKSPASVSRQWSNRKMVKINMQMPSWVFSQGLGRDLAVWVILIHKKDLQVDEIHTPSYWMYRTYSLILFWSHPCSRPWTTWFCLILVKVTILAYARISGSSYYWPLQWLQKGPPEEWGKVRGSRGSSDQ